MGSGTLPFRSINSDADAIIVHDGFRAEAGEC